MTIPVSPDRGRARELLLRELSRSEYQHQQPSWLLRAWEWIRGRLSEVQVPGLGTSWTGPLLLLMLLAAVIVTVRLVGGPLRRGARGTEDDHLFEAGPEPSAQHTRRADEAAAAGRWSEAVSERFRAIVRSLEERALIERRPGRTAHEVAVEAAGPLPDCAAALRRAARHFDDVRYGGQQASAAEDSDLRAVAAQVAGSRPAPLASAGLAAR